MAKKGGFLRILFFIVQLIDDRVLYKNLKNDPEERKKTTTFGKSAIGYSIGFGIIATLGALMAAKGFSGDLGIIVGFFAIVLGIIFIVVSVELFIFALSHTVKQIILNRRAISWIALVIFIISVGVSAFAILKVVGSL